MVSGAARTTYSSGWAAAKHAVGSISASSFDPSNDGRGSRPNKEPGRQPKFYSCLFRRVLNLLQGIGYPCQEHKL